MGNSHTRGELHFAPNGVPGVVPRMVKYRQGHLELLDMSSSDVNTDILIAILHTETSFSSSSSRTNMGEDWVVDGPPESLSPGGYSPSVSSFPNRPHSALEWRRRGKDALKTPKNKVLPEAALEGIQLRRTQQGSMLQAMGTISARKERRPDEATSERFFKSPPPNNSIGSTVRRKLAAAMEGGRHQIFKRTGSVPDLRHGEEQPREREEEPSSRRRGQSTDRLDGEGMRGRSWKSTDRLAERVPSDTEEEGRENWRNTRLEEGGGRVSRRPQSAGAAAAVRREEERSGGRLKEERRKKYRIEEWTRRDDWLERTRGEQTGERKPISEPPEESPENGEGSGNEPPTPFYFGMTPEASSKATGIKKPERKNRRAPPPPTSPPAPKAEEPPIVPVRPARRKKSRHSEEGINGDDTSHRKTSTHSSLWDQKPSSKSRRSPPPPVTIIAETHKDWKVLDGRGHRIEGAKELLEFGMIPSSGNFLLERHIRDSFHHQHLVSEKSAAADSGISGDNTSSPLIMNFDPFDDAALSSSDDLPPPPPPPPLPPPEEDEGQVSEPTPPPPPLPADPAEERRRMWTPEQDLEDESDKESVSSSSASSSASAPRNRRPPPVKEAPVTPPKLTAATSMFPRSSQSLPRYKENFVSAVVQEKPSVKERVKGMFHSLQRSPRRKGGLNHHGDDNWTLSNGWNGGPYSYPQHTGYISSSEQRILIQQGPPPSPGRKGYPVMPLLQSNHILYLPEYVGRRCRVIRPISACGFHGGQPPPLVSPKPWRHNERRPHSASSGQIRGQSLSQERERKPQRRPKLEKDGPKGGGRKRAEKEESGGDGTYKARLAEAVVSTLEKSGDEKKERRRRGGKERAGAGVPEGTFEAKLAIVAENGVSSSSPHPPVEARTASRGRDKTKRKAPKPRHHSGRKGGVVELQPNGPRPLTTELAESCGERRVYKDYHSKRRHYFGSDGKDSPISVRVESEAVLTMSPEPVLIDMRHKSQLRSRARSASRNRETVDIVPPSPSLSAFNPTPTPSSSVVPLTSENYRKDFAAGMLNTSDDPPSDFLPPPPPSSSDLKPVYCYPVSVAEIRKSRGPPHTRPQPEGMVVLGVSPAPTTATAGY
ncbi:unnamed protein product [Cyprideis torosa]|uniref:Uncharacterized protein n=1 Tax=Cyprideis torosa TaxID=163714 RepID=A0A7R8WBK1_9CRUS|nr:unnamed protein product [Cyprideis torosa]CAG0887032.1 unnamed protein product [Cyprideis torosa]